MKKALVIGKFYPPHNGHSYLIDTALAEAAHVDVLVCDHPSYRLPAEIRVRWLQQLHPAAHVQAIPDIEHDEDSALWAKHTAEFLGYKPDMVFTSEAYGHAYAAHLGATHSCVDQKRHTHPIHAREIRTDVLRNWHHLKPLVRSHFALRVCIVGAESTGTTTLTRALANAYHAPWVPEYGRFYTEGKMTGRYQWRSDEFVHIATIQQAMEDELAGDSDGLLFCDTDALATKLWHQRYLHTDDPRLDILAAASRPQLYIITGDEIPFVQDGIRDGEHIRHAMHRQFVTEIKRRGIRAIMVRGTVGERLQKARQEIDAILKKPVTI